MPTAKSALRRSVTLPQTVVRRVDAIAKREKTSSSRVIVELIETGLEARELEKREFLELADRLTRSSDAAEQARIKAELARRTFGE
jgi:metal-responsive CopG/Arc/MetJ family transcriptional regulator